MPIASDSEEELAGLPAVSPAYSPLAQSPSPEEKRADAERLALSFVLNNAGRFTTDVAENAGKHPFYNAMTAKSMFGILTYYRTQNLDGRSLGIGDGKDMVFAHPSSADKSALLNYRNFAQKIDLMGRMYAEFPFSENVRNAGQTLIALAAPVLDDMSPVQSIMLSEDLVDALYVICDECADLYDRTDLPVKSFYSSQLEKIEQAAMIAPRYKSMYSMQQAALREAKQHVSKDYKVLNHDAAACMYKHLYWHASLHRDANWISADAPMYQVQYTGDEMPSLSSEIKEQEIFPGEWRRVINGDPAQNYIAIVRAFGEAYLTDKNKEVVEAARSLLDIANEAGSKKQPIRNSKKLQDAFSSIALHGTATLA